MEEKLKIAIVKILDIDLGIYPKSITGGYNHRTPYMNGWNAASIKHIEGVEKAIKEAGIQISEGNEFKMINPLAGATP